MTKRKRGEHPPSSNVCSSRKAYRRGGEREPPVTRGPALQDKAREGR